MNKINTRILLIGLCVLLGRSAALAQLGTEIKFSSLDGPLNFDKNLVSVSAIVNPKQSTADGIHLALVVKNISGKAVFIKNTASQLKIALYNELGFDISVKNVYDRAVVDDVDRSWKFRSEALLPICMYTNGEEEKIDIKMREYFEISSGGTSKIDLVIRNVKKITVSSY